MNSFCTKLPCLLLLMALTVGGCQRSSSDADLDLVVGQPPTASQADSDLAAEIPVPDGDPEELFQFMLDIKDEQLSAFKATNEFDEESEANYVNALRRIMTARVKACDKILAADIEPETKVSAIRMKLDALGTLSIVDADRLGQQYEPFATELARGSDARLADIARGSLFQARVNQFLTDPEAGSASVVTELERLLDQSDQSEDVFVAARDAIGWMFRKGHIRVAAQSFKQLATSYLNHENPKISDEANSLLTQAIQLELNQDIDRVLAGEADSIPALLKALAATLDSTSTSDADRLGIGVQTAQTLEFTGRFEAAREVYGLLHERFSGHADPSLAEDVDRTVRLAYHRMDLIGQPLHIDGVLIDGEPFVWKSYRGRHVIVCFWTSWDTGWPDQVRQIRQTAAAYRDRGLKVVTINLDDDRNALERYLQSNPLSWPIVVDSDFNTTGFENKNAVRCGVEAVPFMLLVDPEGKVVDVHVMGARLKEALDGNLNGPDEGQSQRRPLEAVETRFVAHLSPESKDEAETSDDEIATDEAVTDGAETGEAATATDEDRAHEDGADEALEKELSTLNPYAPPADTSAIELIDFIMEMEDKPRSIQKRPGFSEGVVQAVDQLLEMEAKARWKTHALLAKFHYLHRDAALGDETAEAALRQTIDQWKDDTRTDVCEEIRFLQLEQRARSSDEMSPDELSSLLVDLHKFFESGQTAARHLRLASLTVHAVNRLEDGDEREKHFASFGALFGKSDDKQVAAYGRRIASSDSNPDDLINTKMELAGVTAAGNEFHWESYRERWIVVDFWATWCGPCRRAMPELRKLADQYKDRSLEVVGVSLDEDLKALAEYLDEEDLPWTILAGSGTNELAKKYGVRAIPQLFLVDGEGTIRFVTNRMDEMAARIAKELP